MGETIEGAQYYGQKAIAKRMGISVKQLVRLHQQADFFMFKTLNFARWPNGARKGGKLTWYTNEAMIAQWRLLQVKRGHQEARKGKGRI